MKKSIFIALAAALLLTGCSGSVYSNHRDTERLQVVETIGLDTSDTGLQLSLGCAKGEDSGPQAISQEGRSIAGAMAEAEDYSGERQLFYAHAQYMVFGETLARQSLEAALDFVARSGDLRLGMELFVLRGSEAEELICKPPEGGPTAGQSLGGIAQSKAGGGKPFSARETIRSLSRSGAALICALEARETEGSIFPETEGKTPAAAGYAIIKEDRLVGWVEPELAPAAELILGIFGDRGPLLPDGEGGHVRLGYEEGKCSVKLHEEASPPRLEIKAELRANLAEADTPKRELSSRDYLESLEETLERDTETRILQLLELSRELQADFLGLAPESLGGEWLKEAEFSIDCSAEIRYTRDLSDKMRTEGGDSIERG